MKKILFASFVLLSLSAAKAQDACASFSQFKKGLKTQMTTYDKNDKISSVANQEVIDITNEDGAVVANTKIDFESTKSKKEVESVTTKIKCKNGNILFDFKDLIGSNIPLQKMEGAEIKITGDDVVVPTKLSIGQTLPDAALNMQMLLGGKPFMSMEIKMSDRKVMAQEKVTTSGGTWDCYKITYTISNSTGFGGDLTAAIWLSDGIAVKTETYNKKGVKQGSTMLTKFQLP